MCPCQKVLGRQPELYSCVTGQLGAMCQQLATLQIYEWLKYIMMITFKAENLLLQYREEEAGGKHHILLEIVADSCYFTFAYLCFKLSSEEP